MASSNVNSPMSTSSEAEAESQEYEDEPEVDHFTYSEVYADEDYEYVWKKRSLIVANALLSLGIGMSLFRQANMLTETYR